MTAYWTFCIFMILLTGVIPGLGFILSYLAKLVDAHTKLVDVQTKLLEEFRSQILASHTGAAAAAPETKPPVE